MTRPAQHPASNSESRKRNTPEPTCLPCGNKIPGFADALAQARAEALAPVLALADEWERQVQQGHAENPDGHRALSTHERDLQELRAAAQAGEVRRDG